MRPSLVSKFPLAGVLSSFRDGRGTAYPRALDDCSPLSRFKARKQSTVVQTICWLYLFRHDDDVPQLHPVPLGNISQNLLRLRLSGMIQFGMMAPKNKQHQRKLRVSALASQLTTRRERTHAFPSVGENCLIRGHYHWSYSMEHLLCTYIYAMRRTLTRDTHNKNFHQRHAH